MNTSTTTSKRHDHRSGGRKAAAAATLLVLSLVASIFTLAPSASAYRSRSFSDLAVTDSSITYNRYQRNYQATFTVRNTGFVTVWSGVPVELASLDGTMGRWAAIESPSGTTTFQTISRSPSPTRGRVTLPALAPGASVKISVSYYQSRCSTSLVQAEVDPDDNLAEMNEGNNVRQAVLCLPG